MTANRSSAILWMVRAVFLALVCRAAPVTAATPPMVKVLETAGGVRFGVLGDRPAAPAATLFLFATTVETTLGEASYSQVGRLLLPAGVLVVAIDVPGHGQDRREGEPEGISAWPIRLSRNEPLLEDFAKRASAVLDHLVAEKYTDPERVAAAGTSRGGYMALQFAAAEPRVRAVAGFSPVTRPGVLSEFAEMKGDAKVDALALAQVADKLANRSVWLIIGDEDARVSTDECVAFARRLSTVKFDPAAGAKPRDISLLVLPASGHRTPDQAHERAALWFQQRLLSGAKLPAGEP